MGDKLSENIRGGQVGVSKTHHREHRVTQRGGCVETRIHNRFIQISIISYQQIKFALWNSVLLWGE